MQCCVSLADWRSNISPQKTVAPQKTIAIVGPGNVGRVLALALHRAGFRVTEIIARDEALSLRKARALAKRVGASVSTVAGAKLDASVLWLCVTDGAIAQVASELAKRAADWKQKVVLHASGALTSSELTPLKYNGAAVGSLHPMNTFVVGSKPNLNGTPFGVEGDGVAVRVGREIARKINGGAEVFTLKPDSKVLYHAVGSFSSPLLVSLLNVVERIAEQAGINKPNALVGKILSQTLENFLREGSNAAFSGPIRRGDVATVRKHIAALKDVPGAGEIYAALARNALDNLPVRNAKDLRRAIKGK
ncbi:MAG: hypothetical protein JWO20_1676 [Candidatus Angelobacter sp.]|nr:hypothetical protein [Candidatus Angelobacter sp.]